MKLCKCGCGKEVKPGNRFINGHQNRGKNHPCYGRKHSKETLQKMSKSKSGQNNPFYGKTHSKKVRKTISKSQKGKIVSKETREKISRARKGMKFSKETRENISKSRIGKYIGKDNGNWQGGVSFEPYCNKFNNQLKEEIRNKYDRKCQICGKDESKNITKSGKMIRLSIHHVDMDKEQGCNGKEWKLIPLCMSCHINLHNNRGD